MGRLEFQFNSNLEWNSNLLDRAWAGVEVQKPQLLELVGAQVKAEEDVVHVLEDEAREALAVAGPL